MDKISNEMRQALLYVKKHGPVPIYEFPFEITRLDLMLEKNYVYKVVIRGKRYSDGHIEHIGVKITANGKDALFWSRDLKKELLTTRVLSISALAVSIIVPFTPFADMCKEWITSILTAIFS